MSCKLTEKVSLLLDGELSADEAERLAQHISACTICSSAREDFLRLRRQIKAYEFTPDQAARQRALAQILKPAPLPLWRRRLAVPVPVFAVIVLMVAVVAWAIFPLLAAKPSPAVLQPNDPAPASHRNFDLSRFDHGERAEIYTVPRQAGTR